MKCLHCDTLLIKISFTKHLTEMHPHLNKRLNADLVPQVDFTYTDDYEWATFLKGSLPHLGLPDFLAEKLATPPTGEVKQALIDKWENMVRNRNGTYPHLR